jgi:thioredoxin 1
MRSLRTFKRRFVSHGTVALAVASVMTRMNAVAFTSVDTALISPTARPHLKISTKLLAKDGPSEEQKLSIDTVNDENRHTLLHPASDPKRPVLVDAFAPWCGPCKLLDKILRKAQPRYHGKVDFCRWNVNDKEGTAELKKIFLDSGYTLTKLPSLIVFREGKPVAVRPGLANDFQLDFFLEETLPDVLEPTFDEDGIKLLPLPEETMVRENAEKKVSKAMQASNNKEDAVVADENSLTMVQESITPGLEDLDESQELIDCTTAEECWERVEQTIWQNRTVIPALDGVLLPSRSYGSP